MRNTNSDSASYRGFSAILPTLIILLSSLFASGAGLADDSVGSIKFTRGDVVIESKSGERRKAKKGEDLERRELVVTGVGGLAVIQLRDDSRMVVRPNSEFRVDRLDVDDGGKDSSGQQNAILNLLRGGLRLVTGAIGKANPDRYRLITPVATVGIRGTEFNTRLCRDDCAAEEKELGEGGDAGTIEEGLYVNVDDGRVFLRTDAAGGFLELDQGESGYAADSNALPIKLAVIPAFLRLDRVPSPSDLDFDDIRISDDDGTVEEAEKAAEDAVVEQPSVRDVAGDYELDDISYGASLPIADRRNFFGASPDLEFTLTQDGDNIGGEFEGDRDGKIIKGKIDGDQITIDFYFEARGGEYKEGTATWTVQDNGDLKGDFKIRDPAKGVVRGFWTLEKD